MSRLDKKASVVGLVCLAVGYAAGVYTGVKRGIPFVKKVTRNYSIGVYVGESPLSLAPSSDIRNPVLTAADVSDMPAEFVADPFMVQEGDTWYMFFEAMNEKTNQGDIGLATSADGLRWTYRQIVLDEPFHLSFPYVFKWQDAYYMVPESGNADSIRLYKATAFPTEWSFVGTLLEGSAYADSAILRYADKWWLFTTPNASNDTLLLFYADELLGPWTEHPMSPIVERDTHTARLGGPVLSFDGRLVRYAQDDATSYGAQVRAFEITDLTTASYEETLVADAPLVGLGESVWNSEGMHQVDPHQVGDNKWIAPVDGLGKPKLLFGLQY